MSDLSEMVEKYINEIQEGSDADFTPMDDNIVVTQVPVYATMRDYYTTQVQKAVRRYYRHENGKARAANPVDALNNSRNVVQHLTPVFFSAMADGAQIGQEATNVVKKHLFFDTLNEIMTSEAFRTESVAIASTFSLDEDTLRFAQNYLWNSTIMFGAASGFKDMENNGVYKVWDCYMFMAMSACVVAYVVGNRIGREWKTQNVLSDIMRATEENNDA